VKERAVSDKPEQHIFQRYRDIVDDYDAFEEALMRPLPVTVCANPMKITRDALAERLKRDGYEVEPIPDVPEGLKVLNASKFGNRVEYRSGLLNIQEQVSMYPVMLLDPQPGEHVLDMCAAPGSKTMQIAGGCLNVGPSLRMTVISIECVRCDESGAAWIYQPHPYKG